jgi:flagellar export protein FliJ
MKAFHFTLEAVRTVRQRQEQAAMEQYAQALVAREQAVQQVNAAREKLNAARHEIRALLAGGYTASKAVQAQEHYRSLQQLLDQGVAALGLAECQVNTALNAMLAMRRQREIVDKFFNKQKSRHQREQLREEQKMLDDLAGRRPSSILSWNPTGGLA